MHQPVVDINACFLFCSSAFLFFPTPNFYNTHIYSTRCSTPESNPPCSNLIRKGSSDTSEHSCHRRNPIRADARSGTRNRRTVGAPRASSPRHGGGGGGSASSQLQGLGLDEDGDDGTGDEGEGPVAQDTQQRRGFAGVGGD